MSHSSIFASPEEDPSDWAVDHGDIFLRPPSSNATFFISEDSYETMPERSTDDGQIDALAFREIVDESWAGEVLRTFNRVINTMVEHSF